MSPFALKGGKRTANLASPNKNVASGLNDMTDYEDVVMLHFLQPIVDKTLVPISASGGGDTVIALNSNNTPSIFAPS